MTYRQAEQVRIGRRVLSLSNLGKILYPAVGFTKGQVIDYYRRVAPIMVKHLRGRPLTLKRYPNGVDAGYFYEKNCPKHKPEWMPTVNVTGKTGTTNYCVINEPAALIWVANLASLELHTLLSRETDLDRPTMMVFDLDPTSPAAMLDCLQIATRLRDMLEHLGLQSFVKTSGSKGLHMYVPLNTPVQFDQTKSFANAIARLLERENPAKVTSLMRKDQRKGKVFVDWSQNDEHKTTVCVYSLRAGPEPTVSMPITWDQVEKSLRRKDASKLVYDPDRAADELERNGDLFEPVLRLKQKLKGFTVG